MRLKKGQITQVYRVVCGNKGCKECEDFTSNESHSRALDKFEEELDEKGWLVEVTVGSPVEKWICPKCVERGSGISENP